MHKQPRQDMNNGSDRIWLVKQGLAQDQEERGGKVEKHLSGM